MLLDQLLFETLSKATIAVRGAINIVLWLVALAQLHEKLYCFDCKIDCYRPLWK